MNPAIYSLSEQLGQAALARNWRLTTAESCTGGGIAQAITAVPGSSQWFDMGFVTYSNTAKQELLEVPPALLNGPQAPGAVSEATVQAMATGALRKSGAQLAMACSGIAGPDGGSKDKPVGTVWLAWAWQDAKGLTQSRTKCFHFDGNRASVREQTIKVALAESLFLANTVSME